MYLYAVSRDAPNPNPVKLKSKFSQTQSNPNPNPVKPTQIQDLDLTRFGFGASLAVSMEIPRCANAAAPCVRTTHALLSNFVNVLLPALTKEFYDRRGTDARHSAHFQFATGLSYLNHID